jgi:DNA processing protein
MILTANDIIEDLGWSVEQQTEEVEIESPLANLNPTEQIIYKAFDSAATLDWAGLTAATGLTMGELAMALMDMELKGLVRCLPGKRYERI